MKSLFQIGFILMISFTLKAAEAPPILSFKEWKAEKINTAVQQTVNMRNLILKTKASGLSKNLPPLEKQLTQLNWNLDVAQDLSITDYFVLYLSQQAQKDRFKIAASKLSTAEIADLMQEYAQSLANTPNPNIESTASASFTSQALVAPDVSK